MGLGLDKSGYLTYTSGAMKSQAKMLDGKAAMRERCYAVALANTPQQVRLVKIIRGLNGTAYPNGTLRAPRPATRKALYIFLHECGHFALGHLPKGSSGKPRHREEYEAERFAIEKMRLGGIPVPAKMVQRAKRYVAWKIRQAVRRGAKEVDREAQAWAGRGDE